MSLSSAQNSWVNESAPSGLSVGATSGLTVVNCISSVATGAGLVPLTVAGTAYALWGAGLSYTTGTVNADIFVEACATVLQSATPVAGTVVFTLVNITVPASPVLIATSASLALSDVALSTIQFSGSYSIINVLPSTAVILQLYATATTTTTATVGGVGCIELAQPSA